MAAAVDYGGGAYPRSPSLSIARSPDTASSIYPERAIRPLPKNRLKSKLSPEQASTIIYPPDPPPMSPTLHFSAQDHDSSPQHGFHMTNGHAPTFHDRDHHHHEVDHHRCTCGGELESEDEEVEFDHPDYRYMASPGGVQDLAAGGKPLNSMQRRLLEASQTGDGKLPASFASANSSADGYESFENTSNKKKRKIPLSSATGAGMHQVQLSAEMASMGISNGDGAHDDGPAGAQGVAHHHSYAAPPAASGAGTGISGAGRGRYGRQNGRNERRPLSTMNSANAYGARVPPRSGAREVKVGPDVDIENTGGIISQAIKSAAEYGPLTPPSGESKDNISLLQSAASSNSTPRTQFTFSCESESGIKMVDQQATYAASPGYNTPGPAYGTPATQYGTPTPGAASHTGRGVNGQPTAPNRMNAQGTQTTPSHGNNAQQPGAAARQPQPPGGQQPMAAPLPPPKPPKVRRRPSKEYALAARQRRVQQEYTNYHHRPTKDNMWICEFCEYEDIFGVPPVAMIRKYEIKDRQERKKAAEKQRLLEKAKMKNRKGKKGKGKGGNGGQASANGAGAPPPGQNYDPNLPPPDGEDYYDDEEYGDEYEPMGPDEPYDDVYYPPPPAPVGTPAGLGGGGIPRMAPPA